MITEREYTVFKPIKLTISTQEELDTFKELIELSLDYLTEGNKLHDFIRELEVNLSCYE